MIKPKPQAKPRLQLPTFWDEIVYTVIFVVVVTVLFDMAIPRSLIDGGSMEPSFYDRDRLIVSRLHYLVGTPQRGDVVVFNSLQDRDNQDMLIKRVIGIPGDTVDIRDRQLYVNGEQQTEPYIAAEDCRLRCGDRTWNLAAGEYFVMGDNRNHSNDSRAFGPVPLDHIVGRAVIRFWPLSRIDFLNAPAP